MTGLVARAVLWLALAAVLLVSGFHFVYYLILWEWTRAAIAGVGFASALVMSGTYLLLTRLLRIERRLDALVLATTQEPAGVVQGTPTGASDGEPRPDFPWLATSTTPYALSGLALGVLAIVTPDGPERSVFIPVFLAAGLVISVVAGGVERIAAMRQRARSASSSAPLPTATQVLGGGSRMVWGLPVLLLVMSAVVVGGLYWTTHYWSRPIGAGITTMAVEVDRRGGAPTDDIDVVEVMARYCSINAGTTARYVDVRKGPGGSTLLRVRPLLDDDAQRRYTGCLEDAALEWHRLTVTSIVLAPR